MKSDIQESICATRKEFEKSFSSGEFYNRQTQDEEHLKQIIDFLHIKDGMRILDLGVGSGYMSFPIAKENVSCEVARVLKDQGCFFLSDPCL